MNDCVTKYLSGILNRSENIGELLTLCIKESNSKAGAFFIRKGDTNT